MNWTVWIVSLPFLSNAHADIPEWAKNNSQKLSGSKYQIACSGEGPSVDIARREARESCQSSASQQIAATNIRVKSLSVETEREVAFHREVSEEMTYPGLTCLPGREQIEDHDRHFKVWTECLFD